MNTLKAAMDADTVEYKIVTGDFNTDQYKEEFAEIFGEDYNISNGMNGIFLDTFNGKDDTMKVLCVDNVITSKNIEIKAVQMLDNRLSDHNMLFADVIFKEAEPEPTPVDKTALEKAIKDAEALSEKAYTADSWKAMQDALKVAKAVAEDKEATATEVEAARLRLVNAVKDLVKAEEGKPNPNPSNPSEPEGDNKNPNPSDKDKTEGTENTDKAVSTGDSTNLMLWGMILLAACGIVFGTVKRRNK